MDYNDKKFIFEAGEYISKSEEFIRKILHKSEISIYPENAKIRSKLILIQNEKYNISVLCSYKFINQDEKAHIFKLKMNATVLDAKNYLAIIYDTNSDNIEIFDTKTKVSDSNKLLNELEEIHFDVNGESKPAPIGNSKTSDLKPTTPTVNSKHSHSKPTTPTVNSKTSDLKPTTPTVNSKTSDLTPTTPTANFKNSNSKSTTPLQVINEKNQKLKEENALLRKKVQKLVEKNKMTEK